MDHRFVAAVYDPVTQIAERLINLGTERDHLVEGLEGRVLEIGTGTGRLLPYLCRRGDLEVHAVEPDRHMRKRARRRIIKHDYPVDLLAADATELPYQDGQFDTILTSMVLCSIDNVNAALDEFVRVLAPGGDFRYLEHVAANGWRGGVQQAAAPAWYQVAAGCHLHRDTGAEIADHPGFTRREHERIDIGITPVRPFIRGRAITTP